MYIHTHTYTYIVVFVGHCRKGVQRSCVLYRNHTFDCSVFKMDFSKLSRQYCKNAKPSFPSSGY